VACNYHYRYLGWVLTWKYLKQEFWGKILVFGKILGVKTKIANDYNDHDHENRKGKNIINMFSLAK
jgi:hypothetical protein